MLDYNSLIERITEEVIKRLKYQENFLNRKKIVILNGLSNSNAKDLISDLEVSHEIIEDVEFAESLILEEISNEQLYMLSQNRFDDKFSALVLEALIKGKKVILLKEGISYRKFEKTCPKLLFEQLETFEEKLKLLGIKIVEKAEVKEVLLLEKEEVSLERVTSEVVKFVDLTINRVVSEKQVERAITTDHRGIRIKENAILTPLAKDYIRQEGIKIERI